jgi:hypothetical protein
LEFVDWFCSVSKAKIVHLIKVRTGSEIIHAYLKDVIKGCKARELSSKYGSTRTYTPIEQKQQKSEKLGDIFQRPGAN